MPEVSVIVPAYRARATLARCVAAILAQDHPSFEVVVVVSADTESELPQLDDDPRLRVVGVVPRMPAATARNRAVRDATGDLLAFTDADVIVPPHWLRELVAASQGGTKVVAGSVRNGTPDSAAGTAEYLVEFLDLHPGRPVRSAWHGATCNMLVPRSLWERYGPYPEDMGGGEDTILTGLAREEGTFTFAPRADVTHLNRTDLGAVMRHQYEFGKFTADLGRRDTPYKFQALVRHTALAPVATAGRVVSIYARAMAWMRGARLRSIAISPLVVATIAAWGAGLLVEGWRLDRRRRGDGPRRP
jgi:glycosyltransferase involved in cell wall biosynthesis